jgi:outer membrane cobalamin receptor
VTWFAGASRLRANVFETTIDNMIDFDYVTYAFANTADAEIRGVELALDVPVTDSLVSLLQASWLDTEDAGGLELLRRPEWSASWTVHGGLWGSLSGDLTVLWVGSRPDVDPLTFERIELDGRLTGDVSLSYEVLSGLHLNLRVRNLADTPYEEVAGYPAPGRRIIGGLRWRL